MPKTLTTTYWDGDVEVIEEEVTLAKDAKTVQESEDAFLPVVISPEANFLRLPFFALSWRGLKEKTTSEYRFIEEREGKKVELSWQVSASAAHGYPNPFDRRVARAIDALIDETFVQTGCLLDDKPIPFSIYRIARLMEIKSDGANVYERIRESIRRLVATTVTSKGSFWLKDEKIWVEDVFHLYERVRFKGRKLPDGTIADTNYLWLDEFYRRNINARYARPLDYQYLKSLSDLGSRLYELLSGKFYGLPEKINHFRIGYLSLCDLLPITPQKHYSLAKQQLDPAHEELMDTGYLSRVVYQRYEGKKEFNLKYYLGKRAKAELGGELHLRAKSVAMEEQMELPLQDKEHEQTEQGGQLLGIAVELHERGLSKSAAREFAQTYPEKYIREKLEVFDFLLSTKNPLVSDNPAGWLRRAIEQDYKLSAKQRKAAESHAEKLKAQARKERWLEHRAGLVEQQLRDWDNTPKEELIDKGLLTLKTQRFKWDNKREPDEGEIAAFKQEFMDSLPETEEGRRRYIEKRLSTDPPEDFE